MTAMAPQTQPLAPDLDRFGWSGGDLSTEKGGHKARIEVGAGITQDIGDAETGRVPQDLRDQVRNVKGDDMFALFSREIRMRNNEAEVYGLRLLSAADPVKYGSYPLSGVDLPGVAVVPVKNLEGLSEAMTEISGYLREDNFIALLGGMEYQNAKGRTCIPAAAILRVVRVGGQADGVKAPANADGLGRSGGADGATPGR